MDLPATVPEALARRSVDPDAPFLIDQTSTLSYGEADRRSAVLGARLLTAGVGKGTRVGVLYENGAGWLVSWLAAARIGALTVPLSTFAPGPELLRTLVHADVSCVLSGQTCLGESLVARWEDCLPGLSRSAEELRLADAPYLRWIHVEGEKPPAWSRDLPEPAEPTLWAAAQNQVVPADALAIVCTSGVTAAPKAVVHTHGSLVRHGAAIAKLRGLNSGDRVYSAMPFFWVGGLTTVLLYCLTSGAGAVVQGRFEPREALDLIERKQVTFVACWPDAARAIAADPTFSARDLSSVRGGTLFEALPAENRPTDVGLNPIQLGMTETGGPHTNPDNHYRPLPEHLRGTFGRSLPGIEHRVVNELGQEVEPGNTGELLVRGPLLMQQLYKVESHDTFTSDGWYPTGDLCDLDTSGYLRFRGRASAMIKTAGANVAPPEVEGILTKMAGVQAAYVFGVQAEGRGQDVAAVVVVARGMSVSIDHLRDEARRNLSSFKVPRQWRILDEAEVPMLPSGKADLRSLRRLFES